MIQTLKQLIEYIKENNKTIVITKHYEITSREGSIIRVLPISNK